MTVNHLIIFICLTIRLKADDSAYLKQFLGPNNIDFENISPESSLSLKELINNMTRNKDMKLSAQYAYQVPATSFDQTPVAVGTNDVPSEISIYTPANNPSAAAAAYVPSVSTNPSSPSATYPPSISIPITNSAVNPLSPNIPSQTYNPSSPFPTSPPGTVDVSGNTDVFVVDVYEDTVVQMRLKLLCAITRERLKMDLPEQRKEKMRKRLRNRCSQFPEESVKEVEAQNRAERLMRG